MNAAAPVTRRQRRRRPTRPVCAGTRRYTRWADPTPAAPERPAASVFHCATTTSYPTFTYLVVVVGDALFCGNRIQPTLYQELRPVKIQCISGDPTVEAVEARNPQTGFPQEINCSPRDVQQGELLAAFLAAVLVGACCLAAWYWGGQ